MSSIETTAFHRPGSEGRLSKFTHKAPTQSAGRFGLRGESAITLDPPINLEAAFAAAQNGDAGLSFLAGSITNFEHLPALVEALNENL